MVMVIIISDDEALFNIYNNFYITTTGFIEHTNYNPNGLFFAFIPKTLTKRFTWLMKTNLALIFLFTCSDYRSVVSVERGV